MVKTASRRQHTASRQRAHSANLSGPAPTPFLRQLRATAATQGGAGATAAPEAEEPKPLSAKTTHLVEDIRRPFMELADLQGGLQRSAKTLAPKFMRAFGAWQTETGGTFVAFVVLLDPAVPADRTGYRAHSSYQAAEYLRRLMAAKSRPEAAEDDGAAPATPVEALAAVLATLAQFVDMAPVWKALESKLRWTPQQVKRLQQRVGESPPSLLGRSAPTRLRAAG